MTWSDSDAFRAMTDDGHHNGQSNPARIRLSGDLLSGRYPMGEPLPVSNIAKEYDLDRNSVFRVSAPNLALVRASQPKEMYEAYAIRAALEEIGGRAAAGRLRGNTEEQRCNAGCSSKSGFRCLCRTGCAFPPLHPRSRRQWNSLAFDIRIRATISNVMDDLPKVVESHQPIVDALERGQGMEAGLLLRNHVEAFAQFLRKAEMDSAFFYHDLKIARDVQRAFTLQQAPGIPGLNCETFYKPAHSVGGDYYDFLQLHNGRWEIAIGDVSGKGIGAALTMASLQESLRAQALQPDSDPAALINHVNHLVHQSSPAQFYASLFYGEYDPAIRALRYVNAGQNPPIVIRCKDGQSTVFRLLAGSRRLVGKIPATSHPPSVWRRVTSLWLAPTELSKRKT